MMTEKDIEQHIEIRAKALAKNMAETMFEEWKASYKLINSVKTMDSLSNLTVSSLSGRRKDVFMAVKSLKTADRHEVLDYLTDTLDTDISPGTICGRLYELEKANLIETVAIREGKFGKDISVYGIKDRK